MEKFGIFDIIDKLTSQKKQPTLPPSNETGNQKPPAPVNSPKKETKKSNAYMSTLALIKKHDEISKRIDRNNKVKKD